MRHYPSFENQKYDHTLDNDMIIAENKIDGQNFVARYNARTKEFIAFGSKKMIVDETHEQFGNCVKIFKEKYEEIIKNIIKENSKKKGYLEPKTFYELFDNTGIKLPEIIYKGSLTQEFIQSINENDWTKPDCLYPTVKEGVVCKRTTMLKGQRLPMVKVKTNWWINKLKEKYPNNWKELE